MKNQKRHLILLVAVLGLFLNSCLEEFDFQTETFESAIVVSKAIDDCYGKVHAVDEKYMHSMIRFVAKIIPLGHSDIFSETTYFIRKTYPQLEKLLYVDINQTIDALHAV